MTNTTTSPRPIPPLTNFDAPALLRKRPSLNNQRRTEGPGPYLLLDGTLNECVMEFMAGSHTAPV
jgi:hypothetical protein